MKQETKSINSIFHSLWALVFLFFIIAAVAASCGGGGGGGDGNGGGGGGGPITVSGKVVDNTGAPVSAASVVLNNNFAALQTTPAGGTFSFSNVTPPYTLTVRSGTAIREYRNLSRSNPQISVSGGVIYGATLGGNVTGPTYPLPAGNRIIIGATNGVFSSVSTNTATGAYIGIFSWLGNTNTTTDLVALRFTYISPDITGYSQMGKRTGVNLSDGVNQSGLDIALSNPVSTASTTFNYNLGAYTTAGGGRLWAIKADGAFFFSSFNFASGSSVLLPNEGGTFIVTGSDASGNSVIRIAPAVLGGTTTLDLPSSTALQNSLPANGAINVSKTPTLNWTPVAGAELYVISLSGPGLNYSIIIPGTSNNLTIPDYTALGLPLSGSTAYSWSVIGVKDWGGSSDTITDPAGMGGGFNILSLYMASSLTYYTSANTAFTTVP